MPRLKCTWRLHAEAEVHMEAACRGSAAGSGRNQFGRMPRQQRGGEDEEWEYEAENVQSTCTGFLANVSLPEVFVVA